MVASRDLETLLAAACMVHTQELIATLLALKVIDLALMGTESSQSCFRLLTATADRLVL